MITILFMVLTILCSFSEIYFFGINFLRKAFKEILSIYVRIK